MTSSRTLAARPTTLVWAGAALAALVGLIHLVETPEYLEEEPYIGVLFLVGGVALLAAAAAMVVPALARYRAAAWAGAALACALMIIGGVLSRTTGLPSFKEDEWEPLLVVSIVLELAYLGVWATVTRRR
jgi:hypothetical protein